MMMRLMTIRLDPCIRLLRAWPASPKALMAARQVALIDRGHHTMMVDPMLRPMVSFIRPIATTLSHDRLTIV